MRRKVRAMKNRTENTGFPTLEDVKRLHIVEAIKIARSKQEAATMLGISIKSLYDNMERMKISWPLKRIDREGPGRPVTIHAEPEKKILPGPSITTTRKDDGRDVSTSVSPEERDHYYNCDYPWGTYHGTHRRKIYPGKTVEPYHALGYGED